MAKRFIIALSALAVFHSYARHPELESVDRLKAEIQQKEQQLQGLVNQVSSLRMKHAQARSRALSAIAVREGGSAQDDGYGSLEDQESGGEQTVQQQANAVRWRNSHGR